MSDERPDLGRYIDALTAPIAVDDVTNRARRSPSAPRRGLAFVVAVAVVAFVSTVAVVAASRRTGEPAHPRPSTVQVVPSTTTSTTTTTSIVEGHADITTAPLTPSWVDDISASGPGLLVTGSVQETCHAATVDPQTLGLVDQTEGGCDDPASARESVAPADRPIPGTNNETLSIARVDPTTHTVTTGPVVMTYGSYSDTRPITAYGGDWLWIYAVETIPNGPEVLQVSRATGAVVNTVAVPQLYRPLLAADDDGLWIGESVQGGQCAGCGPPPALTFVGISAASAVTVAATGTATTYWLHATGHRVWASVGTFTHREVVRIDGTDLRAVFRVPESNLEVTAVVGDESTGLWSVVPESPTTPKDRIYRYDVVRIDPATGTEARLLTLAPFTMPTATFVIDSLPFAFSDGSLFVLEPPYRNAFSGYSTIVRVTPR